MRILLFLVIALLGLASSLPLGGVPEKGSDSLRDTNEQGSVHESNVDDSQVKAFDQVASLQRYTGTRTSVPGAEDLDFVNKNILPYYINKKWLSKLPPAKATSPQEKSVESTAAVNKDAATRAIKKRDVDISNVSNVNEKVSMQTGSQLQNVRHGFFGTFNDIEKKAPKQLN